MALTGFSLSNQPNRLRRFESMNAQWSSQTHFRVPEGVTIESESVNVVDIVDPKTYVRYRMHILSSASKMAQGVYKGVPP